MFWSLLRISSYQLILLLSLVTAARAGVSTDPNRDRLVKELDLLEDPSKLTAPCGGAGSGMRRCSGAHGSYHINPDGSNGGFVADTAKVSPNATIDKDASVCGKSEVRDHAKILGKSCVDNSTVSGNAVLRDFAMLRDSTIKDQAEMSGAAKVENGSEISGNAKLDNRAWVFKQGRVADQSEVKECGTVVGPSQLLGKSVVAGTGVFSGHPEPAIKDAIIDDIDLEAGCERD